MILAHYSCFRARELHIHFIFFSFVQFPISPQYVRWAEDGGGTWAHISIFLILLPDFWMSSNDSALPLLPLLTYAFQPLSLCQYFYILFILFISSFHKYQETKSKEEWHKGEKQF